MKNDQNNQLPSAITPANSTDNTQSKTDISSLDQSQSAMNNPDDMKYLLSQLNPNTQQNSAPSTGSNICSIAGMILGVASFFPFIGVASILSLILTVIALFRKERFLLVFFSFILGAGGLLTSPIFWIALLEYECKIYKNCDQSSTVITHTEITSGSSQTTTQTITTSSVENSGQTKR
jgi:hypothetical protein